MTYNISAHTVRRWRHTLDQLTSGQVVTLRPPQNMSEHMLAYTIREALASAKELGLVPYNKINYSISPRPKDGTVVCSPRVDRTPELVSSTDPGAIHEGARDEFDVITVMMANMDAQLVAFPHFNGELESIQNWCSERGFRVGNENPLILEKV